MHFAKYENEQVIGWSFAQKWKRHTSELLAFEKMQILSENLNLESRNKTPNNVFFEQRIKIRIFDIFS